MKKIKDLHIKTYNGCWVSVILLIVLLSILITILGNKLAFDSRFNLILILSIIEFIYLRIYKFSLRYIHDGYDYFNELPCYLCNLSTIMCIIAAITRNNILMAYCFTSGTIGAILALVFPDPYYKEVPLISIQSFGFYGYHALLIITCLSFYLLGLYMPRPIDALWSMLITFLLSCLIHLVNFILRKTGLNKRANYVFTYEPGNQIMEKLYSIFKVKVLYMLPILFAIGAVSFLILLILS